MKNIIDFTNFTKKIFASAVLTSMLATLLMSATVNSAFAVAPLPIPLLSNTITITAIPTKTYGDADFQVTAGSVNAFPGSPALTFTASGACTNPATNNIHITAAGSCTVVVNQDANLTYERGNATTTFVINRKDITVSGGNFANNSMTYDSTTVANIKSNPTSVTFSGVINGDSSTPSKLDVAPGVGILASKNATTTALLNVTFSGYTLTGSKAGNYSLTNQPAPETQTVNKKAITVTPAAATKVYDAATSSAVTPSVNVAVATGDVRDFTQSYVTSNAATAKPMTATGTVIDGNNGENYAITFTNANVGTITKKELTVTGLSAENKIYDTVTGAIGNGTPSLVGLLATDTNNVNVGGSVIMNFISAAIGNGKVVNVTGLTINGTSSNNYSLTQPTLSANITVKDLIITGLSAANKVYDGLTTAVISGLATLVGVINTDQFNVRLGGSPITGNFDTKNASNTKLVTIIGFSASGTAATNYNIIVPTTTADITKRVLNITATGVNKNYDATRTATVILSDDRVVGDVFTISSSSAKFKNKNVGTGKEIAVKDLYLTGADADNYTIASSTIYTTADITAKDIMISATATSKIYDSNRDAVAHLYSNDIENDEVINMTYTNAKFDNRQVGTGKTVTVNTINISGPGSNNYNLLNNSTTTTADITARDLVVTSNVSNKVYDGITAAAVLSLISDVISGDTIGIISSTASNFIDKNVANGKLVTTDLVFGAGADNSNYNLPLTSTTTANITKRTLNMLSASGTDKVYDGSRYGFAVITDDRIMGDVIEYASTTSLFGNKNADDTKHITVRGITATGTDAGNYTLALPRNITTPQNVKITKKAMTITAEDKVKAFGDADPALTATTTGMVTGEVLTGSLIRVAGESIGTYDINQGTTTAGNNYTETFTKGTFTIVKATPTLVITPISSKYTNSSDFNVVSNTNSGLTIAFSIVATTTPVCTVTGNAIHMTGATGTCEITASIAGDTNYLATTTTSSFTVLTVPVVILPPVISSFGGSLISSTNVSNNATVNNQVLQVLGTSKFRFNKNLKLGMKNNNDVKELQKVLNGMGLYMSTSTNGNFDQELFNSVKAYQKIKSVKPVSGFFGPLTRTVINK